MGYVGLFLTVTLANLFTELLTSEDEITTGKFMCIAFAIIAVLALL